MLLVGSLGRWGNQDDIALLSEFCRESSVRVEAAFALARIDSEQALELARQHVKSMVAFERDKPPPPYPNRYWNRMSQYAELFLAVGDRQVTEAYAEFLTHIAAHSEPGYELTYYWDRVRSMLGVLRSKDVRSELDKVARHLRRHGGFASQSSNAHEFLIETLADRFAVAAGGKEEARTRLCAALSHWRDARRAESDE